MSRRDRGPVIGIAGPDRGGWPAWAFTAWAIRSAGGEPRRITPARPQIPEPLHGLVLGGGADVSEPVEEEASDDDIDDTSLPAETRRGRIAGMLLAPLVLVVRWLGSRWGRGGGVDVDRDRLELQLLDVARERELPVLGICRGAQLMNLARGGTLVRHLDQIYVERPRLNTVAPRRPVIISPTSRLAAWMGSAALRVNSLHRHAVERPGAGLRVVARDVSGVVQAIESADAPPWIGVQWHPEYLPQELPQRRLFRGLVEAADRSHPG